MLCTQVAEEVARALTWKSSCDPKIMTQYWDLMWLFARRVPPLHVYTKWVSVGSHICINLASSNGEVFFSFVYTNVNHVCVYTIVAGSIARDLGYLPSEWHPLGEHRDQALYA